MRDSNSSTHCKTYIPNIGYPANHVFIPSRRQLGASQALRLPRSLDCADYIHRWEGFL